MTGPRPAIPQWLAYLPDTGGYAVPWITPHDARGLALFGSVNQDRVQTALRSRLCGVCGRRLDHPQVLLLRQSDLPRQATVEPALHPQCAHYTTTACPMVSGNLDHYRSTPIRRDHTMVPAECEDEGCARLGAPAEPWFAVWVSGYELTDVAGNLAASYAGTTPLRIRPIPPQWLTNVMSLLSAHTPEVEPG